MTTGDDEARIQETCRARLGQSPGTITAVPAGLGLRRFYRVTLSQPPDVLIARIEADEDPAGRPAGVPPEPPLEPTRRLLEDAGLPVPGCFGISGDGHVALLEDGGSQTLEDLFHVDPGRASQVLDTILDDLVRLQRIENPGGCQAFERHLDEATFAYKAELFARWVLPEVFGRTPTAAEHDAVQRAFTYIASVCAEAPQRLAHRDFQSRNLLIKNGRALWIDLQGALLAPPEYDLVCLLHDSYIAWPETVIERALAQVRPRLPDAPDPTDFARRFALLTLSRKGKDLARFRYVAETRSDTASLCHVPTTVQHLKRAAQSVAGSHPDLEPLVDFIGALANGVDA